MIQKNVSNFSQIQDGGPNFLGEEGGNSAERLDKICVFVTKTTAKLILNVGHHGWTRKKVSTLDLPETVLNRATSNLHLTPEGFC